jgi:mRNA interferase RelE/StbE
VSSSILYHPDIPRRDLPPIPLKVQSGIPDAISVRLRGTPEKYGQPLRGTLGGYWKLRVGDHRVVFRSVGDEVWVLAILHRRQVCEDVVRRIGWQPT